MPAKPGPQPAAYASAAPNTPSAFADRLAKRKAHAPTAAGINAVELDKDHLKRLMAGMLYGHRTIMNHWAGYAACEPERNLPEKIEPGISAPAATDLKGFVMSLLVGLDGEISPDVVLNDGSTRPPYPSKNTLRDYLNVIMSCFKRYTKVEISKDVRQQVYQFIDSDDLRQLGVMSTAMREKFMASVDDIILFQLGFLTNPHIHTRRMRVQLQLACNIFAITGSRPGAVVESVTHYGTNEALYYGDLEIYAVPVHPDRPELGCTLVRVLTLSLLKGHHEDNATFTHNFLYVEPNADCALCPMVQIMRLGMDDDVFMSVHTPEDLHQVLHPDIMPPGPQQLFWKDEFLKKPIFRAKVGDGGVYQVDKVCAMTSADMWRKLKMSSLSIGFPCMFSSHLAWILT